ncbi:UPF0114 domain-containing protein [Cephalotus follicularis]|uniref:UPF0114 domain-containing protein n=1 Tax=Cephalotus follicularis TaxID=3775 RepID=A0A1Q3D8A0_CEPFO|nr:UPF0114 domain-containing protein [Cephalotus follicularis]
MATTRLLRSSKPLRHVSPLSATSSSVAIIRCLSKAGFNEGKMASGVGEWKSTVAVKATSESVITLKPGVNHHGLDMATLMSNVTNAMVKFLRPAVKRKPKKLKIQFFFERVLLDCRFFTLFAVAGSLLGSILCFAEGCFLVIESYLQYLHALSQRSDQGHVVHLLIDAIDMYLIGTAMLIFGMGLYVIFVGSRNMKENGSLLPRSNLFGLYPMKARPTWIEMESVSQGKSRIGHAVILILQAGLLEKFKSIAFVTSLDLACLAGALLISSASIFLLSRLSAVTNV